MLGYLHRTNPLKKYAFSRTMRHAVKRSAKILTVSNTSKREIIDYYHVPAAKIAVIYNGIDHEKYNIQVKSEKACPEPASGGVEGLKVKSFKEKYHIDGDYLLYAGLWKKHKNLKRLLEAFEKLKVENEKLKDLRLVITGKKDRDEPEIIEEINRVNNALNSKFLILNSVITTGFLDEAELPIAYTGALAYVIPSLSEGFGMPPVEALACGTPVIASNVSCMPEILGDAALYFDPYDLEDMAKAMERITTDEKLRDEIISKGLEQVKKYNWSNTAKETLDVYRELI
jgi:glycosyltransferase involved in cell wall biosynthesis